MELAQSHPTIASISKKALRQNFGIFREHCGPQVKLCPAVKANAYGHEIRIVAPVLAESGADMFAVATFAEAAELAAMGLGKEILVFGPAQGISSDNNDLRQAVGAGFHFTVADTAAARALAGVAEGLGLTVKVHVKVDTGMGRMGALSLGALELVEFISWQKRLRLEGLYTHFATADEADASFAHEQLGRFNEFLGSAQALAGEVPLIHAANSAAILGMTESHLTMVRPGISMYGYLPSQAMAGLKVLEGLRPILRVESRLVLVKELPAGHSCGYGRTFRAEIPIRVGIVPIGYEDGYRRLFSNRAVMQVKGKDVPVIGRVSMDQTILDLTDVPGVQSGDAVTVISQRREDPNSVESLAELAGTIPHEITCLLGRRVRRLEVEDF